MRNIFLSLALLCSAQICFGQSWEKFEELKKKFPTEDLIVLNKKEQVTLEVVKGKLEIEATHYYEVMFMNDNAPRFAANSVSYSTFFQDINDLEVYSLIPEEKQYKKVQVKNIKTTDSRDNSIFFDDQKQKQFYFEGVKKGAIGIYKYKEKIKDPHLFGTFIFKQYIPILNVEYSVSFPKTVTVSHKIYGNPSSIKFTENKQRGNTVYTWASTDSDKIPYETDALKLLYYAPQVLTLINSYQSGSTTVEVLKDVDELYKWYVSLIKDVNTKPDDELKALVKSLTDGKNELDKIKSIYYWVQDNIKYVAFEDGLGGFVPREANDVIKKRFGDCKDMAGTITTMLKTAGIDAHLTWIGTRDIPYKYSESPSPRSDNHMISSVKYNGKWYFLDGTVTALDFGISPESIQEKEALIMINEDKYEVITVPKEDKSVNYQKDTISLQISGNNVKGQGKITLGGLWRTDIINNYLRATDKERVDYLKGICNKGSNKCRIDDVKASDFKKRDTQLSINYDFTINDYVRSLDDELLINPCLNKYLATTPVDIENKKLDITEKYAFTIQQVISMEIPKGYKLSYLPKDASFSKDLYGYDISYKNEGNKIYMTINIFGDYLQLGPAKFNEWNDFISALNESYNELITLKKI